MLATHCELVCEVDITFYSVSQKKTRPLQLISHNFTNSQCSQIIFGTAIPYSVLHWLQRNSGTDIVKTLCVRCRLWPV